MSAEPYWCKTCKCIHGYNEECPSQTARCGVCFWALYDGDWCQNPYCPMKGKSVNENRVLLTNDEAVAAIQRKGKP